MLSVQNIPSVLIDYLTPHQLKIYMHLKSYNNGGKRHVSFSQTDYCKNHNMSKNTVRAAINFLVDEGIIYVAHESVRKNIGGEWSYLAPQYGLKDYEFAAGIEDYCQGQLESVDYSGVRGMVVKMKEKLNKYSSK